jgi:hypothetical protein
MTQHLHHAAVMSPRQRCRQHDLVALSPALLDIYIASWPIHPTASSPAWLSSIVTRMTRHLHCAAANSPDSVIASMTRQHCRQHDSASISCRDQVTLAVSLPAWLEIYMRHDQFTRQRRRQHYRQHDSASTSCHGQVAPAVTSPAWLGIYITPRPSHPGSVVTRMTRQHCCQHDSTSTSHRS